VLTDNQKLPMFLDVECYPNYFLVMFKSLSGRTLKYFEAYPGKELDVASVTKIMFNNATVGFNSRNYDIPMISLAAKGVSTAELKAASDYIIVKEAKPWDFERTQKVKLLKVDHIDLKEPAPGVMVSLKLYGGRMHSRNLQDLPIPPDSMISPDDRGRLRTYCENDLDTTIDLYKSIYPQIKLRRTMSAEYGIDLRSKSDAQIAEAVIKSEVTKLRGEPLSKVTEFDSEFYYKPPDWMGFTSNYMGDIFKEIVATRFVVKGDGSVELPDNISKMKIAIGSSVYQMGIGGLHSTESGVSHVTDGTFKLIDRDVASYYPRTILNLGMYPYNLGPEFLDVYNSIVERRLEAKRNGDSVVADALKITINGSFGKFGNRYSSLYSPELLIRTTITGQLALLMLIELLEFHGIPIVSANTDGIVMKCPNALVDDANAVIAAWEEVTGYETEATEYAALYSRDVNNYLAVKTNGKVKRKGVFAQPGLMKNPTATVVIDAAVDYLTKQVPLIKTIKDCADVRKLLVVRTANGGAEQVGTYLGKVVRWYYSTKSPGPITYVKNGNKVPKSDGAIPMMRLGEVPDDVDFGRYEQEAADLLTTLGIGVSCSSK